MMKHYMSLPFLFLVSLSLFRFDYLLAVASSVVLVKARDYSTNGHVPLASVVVSVVGPYSATNDISEDVRNVWIDMLPACIDDDSVTFHVNIATDTEITYPFTCKKLREMDTTMDPDGQWKICHRGARKTCAATCGICQTSTCTDNNSAIFYFTKGYEFDYPGDILKLTCPRMKEYSAHLIEMCDSGGSELCPVSCNTCPSRTSTVLGQVNSGDMQNSVASSRQSVFSVSHSRAVQEEPVFVCEDSVDGTFVYTVDVDEVLGFNCETLKEEEENLIAVVCNGQYHPTGNQICPVTCGFCTPFPSVQPSAAPSISPTSLPTSSPSLMPSSLPSTVPSGTPSTIPTSKPSSSPTTVPTSSPSFEPTREPTIIPTSYPTNIHSTSPTAEPTLFFSNSPTDMPSPSPSVTPTSKPTDSMSPSSKPTLVHSNSPSSIPSAIPSLSPSIDFTIIDECYNYLSVNDEEGLECLTNDMTRGFIECYNAHSVLPSVTPSISNKPSTSPYPTVTASLNPTTSNIPSDFPTSHPSDDPTSDPTSYPTVAPSDSPSSPPTSHKPSAGPSFSPSVVPTNIPSDRPTTMPTKLGSFSPSLSSFPSAKPTVEPSMAPTESAAPTICADYPDLFEYQPVDNKNSKSIICNDLKEKEIKEKEFKYYKFDERCEVEKVANKCRMRCGLCGLISLNPTTSPSNAPSIPFLSCKDSRKRFFFSDEEEEFKRYTCETLYEVTEADKFNAICKQVGNSFCPVTCDNCPSNAPSDTPTLDPSTVPTNLPSVSPTSSLIPSAEPSTSPTPLPSSKPSSLPTFTLAPTLSPSSPPTLSPTICTNSEKEIRYKNNKGQNKRIFCKELKNFKVKDEGDGVKRYKLDSHCSTVKIERLCRSKCAVCLSDV